MFWSCLGPDEADSVFVFVYRASIYQGRKWWDWHSGNVESFYLLSFLLNDNDTRNNNRNSLHCIDVYELVCRVYF